MIYRAGLPGWKLAARAGATISLRVSILKDDEAGVYVARSHDLDGLVAEAETLDALMDEVNSSARELLTMTLHRPAPARTELRWADTLPCAA